ncbi:hypothetical protein NDU88_005733 [Pleurodeles waltl]|uniref:Uncharacterized protein n=1 Tax=Pleurodeles waltl TaxID=8319 RepID=A0AAV7MDV3_PLEWA|nr:hypothetical protein NDU88_005733 [Pleurodeles waltl]
MASFSSSKHPARKPARSLRQLRGPSPIQSAPPPLKDANCQLLQADLGPALVLPCTRRQNVKHKQLSLPTADGKPICCFFLGRLHGSDVHKLDTKVAALQKYFDKTKVLVYKKKQAPECI